MLQFLGFVRCELRVILGTHKILWGILGCFYTWLWSRHSRDMAIQPALSWQIEAFFWTIEVRWKMWNITRSTWILYDFVYILLIFNLEVAQWIKCTCFIWRRESYGDPARSKIWSQKCHRILGSGDAFSHSPHARWCGSIIGQGAARIVRTFKWEISSKDPQAELREQGKEAKVLVRSAPYVRKTTWSNGFASGIFQPHKSGYTGAKLFPGVLLLASGLLRLMRLSRIVRLGKLKKFATFLRANDGRVMFGVGQGLGDWYVSHLFFVSKLGCDFNDFQIVWKKHDPKLLGHFLLIWDDFQLPSPTDTFHFTFGRGAWNSLWSAVGV